MSNTITKPQDWALQTGIASYLWPAKAPIANIILQHGYGEYAERYIDGYNGIIPALTDLGFNVYAFDIPGHGGSSGRRGQADLDAVVDLHVRARKTLADAGLPLFLFGHSLGGLITAGSLVRDPANVEAVILSGPALIKAPLPLKLLAGTLSKIAPNLAVSTPLDSDGISRIAEEVEKYDSDPMIYRGKIPALLGASGLKVTKEIWEGVDTWQVPTLVVHGAEDVFTDPQESVRFVAQIQSADKRHHLVETARHELLNDLCRDEILAEILDWMKVRASGAAA